MTNTIIFLGPNDINRLRIYQGIPTVAALKHVVITELFVNTISNPSFTTEIEDSDGKITINIDTDTDLDNTIQYFRDNKNPLKIKVQEKYQAIIEAPRSISPTAPIQSNIVRPAPSLASTFTSRQDPFTLYSPLIPSTPLQPSVGAMSFSSIATQPTLGIFTAFNKPHSINGSVGSRSLSTLNARFVKHTTVDDENSEIYPGMKFLKTWQFRNDGGLNWPNKVKFLFVSQLTGDAMGGPEELPIDFPESVVPGKEVNVSVPMIAPQKSGEYTGFWKLADESGKKFGQRVRVRIKVVEIPKKSVLLNNQQSVADKKMHLARLFPDSAHSDFQEFLNLFFKDTSYDEKIIKATNLDMILNGTFRKRNGKLYTMEKIIKIVSLAKSHRSETYPWHADYAWPTEPDHTVSQKPKCLSPTKNVEQIDEPFKPSTATQIATLLNDEDEIELKKARLQLLFRDIAYPEFQLFLFYFFDETNIRTGSIDEILNGTIRNEFGNVFTMDEIVQKVSMTRTQGAKRYPWL